MFFFFDIWECRTQQKVEPNKNDKKKAIKTRKARNFNRNKKNCKRKTRNTKNKNTTRTKKLKTKTLGNRRIEKLEAGIT